MVVGVLAPWSALGLNTKLREVFRWKQLDYEFPTEEARQAAIQSGNFIQEHNLPLGIEVWNDKVFITVPRWRPGVPSSLNWVPINGEESPKLRPYPDWKFNEVQGNGTQKVVNTFRVRADVCDRLWVIDCGLVDILGQAKPIWSTKLLVFDLKSDTLIRSYTLKESDTRPKSFFANVVVDVTPDDCENAHAYLPDLGSNALVVYSWAENDSWRVKHHYFHFDPLFGDFNIGGVNFQWTDGIFGVALSPVLADGYRKLYFHPLSSINEFVVSTKIVKNKTIASDSYHAYKLLGNRGADSQATASFLDESSGVVFYTQVNKNAVGCWNSYAFPDNYSPLTNAIVAADNETMVFPNDLKVDRNSNLWVLTDRLPTFMYKRLDTKDVNFRVLMAPVQEAIKGTVCEAPKFYRYQF
ncbi:hypothetical protein AAG570_008554 [Ranatra chinensis]|uniref:Protein yellow n=1 Tax=Ranatra chinensis TaxID=642074 RepID=A0ABD0YRC3_9HEMI